MQFGLTVTFAALAIIAALALVGWLIDKSDG